MSDDPEPSPKKGSDEPFESRLDSWKEIAAYLGRGIRTVQRWEREEGLPIHRLLHEKRGNIYARRSELAAWWESRRLTLAASPSDAFETPIAPRLERVTLTSAMTSWPALSPDAHLVAYVSDGGQDGTTPQIWIQQIGGAALRLTSGECEYSHLSFSPDGTRIIFTVTDATGPNLYEMPALGGEPRLLQRGASRGQSSPDGQWLASVPREGAGLRIAARGGAGFRTIASELIDVACATWRPDSRSVVVHARSDPALEPDWWIVPIEGGSPTNLGLVTRLFHEARLFTIPTGVAWVGDSLVFSAAGPRGVSLYRQRFTPRTLHAAGAPEQLTTASEAAWLPNAAGTCIAFVSSRADSNLWSVALDSTTGVATGPLRRLTRGPAPLGYLSITRDFRTLAYFSFRLGHGDIFLRDLQTGVEKALGEGPEGEKGYPVISPSGDLLAYGVRMPGGERATRPIFVLRLTDHASRTLGEDCRGRPREWVDERFLMIERFARLNSIAILDTETGRQQEVVESAELSIGNARLSPDRQWVAFNASRPGDAASVFVAPFGDQPIPESAWGIVARFASHPFWSADGRFLYYTPIGTNTFVRSAVHARRFDARLGLVAAEPIAVHASAEMTMPAYLPGTAPLATPQEIILVLGDFRGDIWLMHLDRHAPNHADERT